MPLKGEGMRIKVELHPDVRRFLRKSSPEIRDAFHEQLLRVCENPVEHSIAYHDPTLSRYILGYFRFGEYVALFGFIAARDEIKVLECRSSDPIGGLHDAPQSGR
jgi:mRNA-degrading endonuclease RelE of RelBE toxin-antitoxin system